jgi:membrane protein
MKGILTVIKESFSEWSKDNASRLSASLAFYTIFSLAPILVIIVTVAGFVLGSQERAQKLIEQAGQFAGPQIAGMLQSIAQHAQQQVSSGFIAGIISIIVIIFGASVVFYELRQSLNIIWEVERKPGGGVMDFIKTRLLSFFILFIIGVLLFIMFAASVGLEALSSSLEGIIPASGYVIPVVNSLVFFGIGIVLFASLFKTLPDADIAWGDVWVGAVVTSALFTIGKFGIGFYLSKSTLASPYGAAGSLVILLAFIYYSAQIFFIGAEFTQVYANRYGSKIRPSEHGRAMPQEEPSEEDQPSEPGKDEDRAGFPHPHPAGHGAR